MGRTSLGFFNIISLLVCATCPQMPTPNGMWILSKLAFKRASSKPEIEFTFLSFINIKKHHLRRQSFFQDKFWHQQNI